MTNKELVVRIFGLITPYRLRLGIAMAAMLMVAALSAAQAYMVKPLLDEIFFKQDRFLLNLLPVALLLLFLTKGVFYYTYFYLLEFVGQSVIRSLRKRVYSHIHSLPLSFFHKTPTGALISRIISDVTLLQSAVSNALVGVLKDACQVVGLIGVIFYQDWKLALLSFIFLPAAFIPITYFGRRFRRLSTRNQETVADISSITSETINGNRIVKAFSMEKYESQRFGALVDRLFAIIMQDTRLRSLNHPLMELLAGIGIAFIIWFGGHQVLKGEATPGTFFSFLTALIMIYEPIKGVSKINSTVQQGFAAAARVFALLDVKVSIADRPAAITLPPFRSSIQFRDVSFTYETGEEVLSGIDLDVQRGEVVAIVGASGSGKSTLVNLIPRFFEVSAGAITIDGRDIRDVTLSSLRSQIAIVTQQTILFNDSVRKNIAYGDPDRPLEEIMAAAAAAHALQFVKTLPQGFDTVVGEGGARLSGGEGQRISIARALLKNAPILILDEATSSLDNESEREVQKALDNLMKNRTTLVIAHRLSTIVNADRIVVLDKGRIREQGNHAGLLAAGGIYAYLYSLQR